MINDTFSKILKLQSGGAISGARSANPLTVQQYEIDPSRFIPTASQEVTAPGVGVAQPIETPKLDYSELIKVDGNEVDKSAIYQKLDELKSRLENGMIVNPDFMQTMEARQILSEQQNWLFNGVSMLKNNYDKLKDAEAIAKTNEAGNSAVFDNGAAFVYDQKTGSYGQVDLFDLANNNDRLQALTANELFARRRSGDSKLAFDETIQLMGRKMKSGSALDKELDSLVSVIKSDTKSGTSMNFVDKASLTNTGDQAQQYLNGTEIYFKNSSSSSSNINKIKAAAQSVTARQTLSNEAYNGLQERAYSNLMRKIRAGQSYDPKSATYKAAKELLSDRGKFYEALDAEINASIIANFSRFSENSYSSDTDLRYGPSTSKAYDDTTIGVVQHSLMGGGKEVPINVAGMPGTGYQLHADTFKRDGNPISVDRSPIGGLLNFKGAKVVGRYKPLDADEASVLQSQLVVSDGYFAPVIKDQNGNIIDQWVKNDMKDKLIQVDMEAMQSEAKRIREQYAHDGPRMMQELDRITKARTEQIRKKWKTYDPNAKIEVGWGFVLNGTINTSGHKNLAATDLSKEAAESYSKHTGIDTQKVGQTTIIVPLTGDLSDVFYADHKQMQPSDLSENSGGFQPVQTTVQGAALTGVNSRSGTSQKPWSTVSQYQ